MSKIPYNLTKIKGVVFDVDGVLSPTVVPMGDDGIPRRMANLKDGYAMKLAVEKGISIAIITGAVAPGLRERMAFIGITDFFGGKLEKLAVLKQWMAERGLAPDEVAFVGDDLPDLQPMRYVGLPVTPADGCIDTMQAAVYVTDAIGGHGVARELLEEILKARGQWPADDLAYGN